MAYHAYFPSTWCFVTLYFLNKSWVDSKVVLKVPVVICRFFSVSNLMDIISQRTDDCMVDGNNLRNSNWSQYLSAAFFNIKCLVPVFWSRLSSEEKGNWESRRDKLALYQFWYWPYTRECNVFFLCLTSVSNGTSLDKISKFFTKD